MGIVGSFMESSWRTRISDTNPAIDGRGVTTESDQTIDRTNWRTFTLFWEKERGGRNGKEGIPYPFGAWIIGLKGYPGGPEEEEKKRCDDLTYGEKVEECFCSPVFLACCFIYS